MSSYDSFMTPKYVWEHIKDFVGEKYITIYESAYGDGESGKYLREIFPNKTIIHKDTDYFKREVMEYDLELSNPPFSITKEWLTEAKERGKPFILLLPSSKINYQYFRNLFCGEKERKIQIIIPKKRIHFVKKVNGKIPDGWKNQCSFDCFYYTWGLGLKNDINWLE